MNENIIEIVRIAANTIIVVAIISAVAATIQVLIENWFKNKRVNEEKKQ